MLVNAPDPSLSLWEESEEINPATHGTIEILGPSGDVKQKWDRNNPDEVSAARELHKSLTKKGYTAFHAHNKTGEREGQMKEFDPTAEGMILVPQIQGGLCAAMATLPRSPGNGCPTVPCTAPRHGHAP